MLVAQAQRYLQAAMESEGSLLHSSFHHWRGDSSISKLGYCKYISNSHLNWLDTLVVPVFMLVEDGGEAVPNIELSFPFILGDGYKPSCDDLSPACETSFWSS